MLTHPLMSIYVFILFKNRNLFNKRDNDIVSRYIYDIRSTVGCIWGLKIKVMVFEVYYIILYYIYHDSLIYDRSIHVHAI